MGTKRQVAVNICSVEGNLAGILVSKVSPSWNFGNKGKMNTYRRERNKGIKIHSGRKELGRHFIFEISYA